MSSQKARNLAARLLAAQAVYQASQNKQGLSVVAGEYLDHRNGMIVDGEEMVKADRALFSKIMRGVEERHSELSEILSANTKDGGARLESLIKAILLCASFELLVHKDIDSPIILNDYLNVAHGFFDDGEVSLINGVLDSVAKIVRSAV